MSFKQINLNLYQSIDFFFKSQQFSKLKRIFLLFDFFFPSYVLC